MSFYRVIAIVKQIFLTLQILITTVGCSLDPQQSGTRPVDHAPFTALLTRHVSDNGLVDYSGLKEDRSRLNDYLHLLSENPPNDEWWSREEKLAYWINVYNAFTLDLILEYYPISSIKDIGSTIQVPFVNTPWDIDFIPIGSEKYTLNDIEHKILRQLFDEPRIHFAINCASMSCPVLRKEAYTGKRIEAQLAEQTRIFLRDESRNQLTPDRLRLSKIFQWFNSDFTRDQSKLDFIRQWADIEIPDDAEVVYLDYDWSLNDIK